MGAEGGEPPSPGVIASMSAAFDEMKGTDGRPGPPIGNWRTGSGRVPPDMLQHRRARGRAAVPPHRHHLRGLWRGGVDRAADPVRRHPAHPRRSRMGRRSSAGCEQRVKAINAFLDDIYGRARDPARPASCPEDLVFQNPVFRPEMNGQKRAARHLRPHRRHRHRARRRRRLLRARGQCAHAVRRLLHAGEPRDHDAAVPRAVRRAIASRRSRTIPTSCSRP